MFVKCLSLLPLLLLVTPVAAMEASRPPSPRWEAHYFNGTAFTLQPEPATPAETVVMTREGYHPFRKAGTDTRERKLPAGAGAVAGICYVQVSGGKLAPQKNFLPAEGVRVTIRQGSATQETVTDAAGFFALPASPGGYRVEAAGANQDVTVIQRKTSLVALRCGKRMRD